MPSPLPPKPPTPPTRKACKVCQTIRHFLILAAFLLLMLWVQPEWRLPAGFDYSALVGDLFLLAFIAMLGYKYWQYRKDRDQ
jgi:hypothetical protein